MFRYCVDPERGEDDTDKTIKRKIREREQLLRFLQISVATWARPDAAHEVSTDRKRDQWYSNARALNLNPRGRTQTKKYRPIVPIASQMAALLDKTEDFYVSVASVTKAFRAMQLELGLPGEGESGMKLIRRSMAKLARDRLGERDWIEGRMMLGHHRTSTSDVYAPFETGYLSRALEVTEAVIADVIALVPKAFQMPGLPEDTGEAPDDPQQQSS